VRGFFLVEGALQFGNWFLLAVVGEVESAVVDGDAGGGAHFFVGADCVCGRDVYGAHEPLGAIGADGEEGEADFREALADGGEMRAVGGVSGEINCAGSAFDDVTAPESFVAVGEGAS